MKRILLFSFVVIGFLLAGCSDNSTVLQPPNSDINKKAVQDDTSTLIKLPFNLLGKKKKVSEKIDGAQGGIIEIHGKIKKGVEYHGNLEIPAGAFVGKKKITIKLDNKYAGFDFGPDGSEFSKPLLFSGEIDGLDLKGVDEDNVKFVFVDKDGNFSPIVSEEVVVNVKNGLLKVIKAQIWHFSRYNWAK